MRISDATAPSWRRELLRVSATLAVVGGATLLLSLADADLAPAVLVYLAVLAVTSALGPVAAVVAAISSYLALNVWFTEPVGTFQVTKSEDIAPLLAFSVAAYVCVRTRVTGTSGPLLAIGRRWV